MHILLKKAKALARRKKLTRAQSQIIRNKMLQTGPIANSTYTDDNSSVIVYRIHVIMCSTGKTHKVLRNCGGETQDFPSILPPPLSFFCNARRAQYLPARALTQAQIKPLYGTYCSSLTPYSVAEPEPFGAELFGWSSCCHTSLKSCFKFFRTREVLWKNSY